MKLFSFLTHIANNFSLLYAADNLPGKLTDAEIGWLHSEFHPSALKPYPLILKLLTAFIAKRCSLRKFHPMLGIHHITFLIRTMRETVGMSEFMKR